MGHLPSFNQLVADAARVAEKENLTVLRVALLGDSTTQFLSRGLQSAALLAGLRLELYEADFGQIERQVQDPGSELYAFQPAYVIVAHTARKEQARFYKQPVEARPLFASERIAAWEDIVLTLNERLGAKLIFFNLDEVDDAAFGNFAAQTPVSWLYQVRRLNAGLADLAAAQGNLFLLDVAALHTRHGNEASFSPHIYVSTDLVHSLDFTALLATRLAELLAALTGRFKKCLILDLDHTLWGGVIGDDGLEGIELGALGLGKVYVELQRWVRQLKDRGIILAVCSKNTDSVAREPFEKHPDMVLKLEDIAVFVANWSNKADNIRYIQEVLNIGFDSMVFLDDNPVERQIVRENVPQVTVPELPEDPALYLEYLQGLNLFETTSFSGNDAGRTRQYQEEAMRRERQAQFTNVGDFLKSLEMTAFVRPFSSFDIPRCAQLSQRSNQFNLRTVRYTEGELETMVADSRVHTFAFNLRDKFGDNGLISMIILRDQGAGDLFIDTWIMSCRVLKRGMEHFALSELLRHARTLGAKRLVGEYLPTPKNALVKDHYADLGFTNSDGLWYIEVEKASLPEFHIERVEQAD